MDKLLSWVQWPPRPAGILWLAFALGMTGLMYQSGLLQIWTQSEEYGHGLMVVVVLGYLVALRRGNYLPLRPGKAGLSVVLAVVALVFVVLGNASGINLMSYYGFWLFGLAAALAVGGFGLLRKLLVPLLIVLLLFPLPNPLGPMLTAELQLISSKLGVWFIRLFGGSVYLEGNVLDMGVTKLLVAEACAGLRYLFPLMSLGAIAAYIMLRTPLWMRWTVFLVTIPITIFMNSFRIGVTGMLVASGGAKHTEGFLHFFEGWVVFVVAALLLLVVIWGLIKLLPGRQGLFDVLSVQTDKVAASPAPGSGAYRLPTVALWVITALMALAVLVSGVLSSRGELMPERKPLNEFPAQIGEWSAQVGRLSSTVEEVAGASDYFYGDFTGDTGAVVNTYVSYYETQRHGRIPHSPKVCVPGGGWVIESQSTATIQGKSGDAFVVNRIVTALGGRRVIAYYWIKQGSGTYLQEFLARLDLVRLSLLDNRTDGALIRLFTEVRPGETLDAGDARLKHFAAGFVELIPAYVPD